MKDKNQARLRRARQTRHKISELKAVRLAVHRSNGHIYAQVIDPSGDKVLTSASTLEPEVRKSVKYGGNIEAGGRDRQAHCGKSKSAWASKRSRSTAAAIGITAVSRRWRKRRANTDSSFSQDTIWRNCKQTGCRAASNVATACARK